MSNESKNTLFRHKSNVKETRYKRDNNKEYSVVL